MKRNTILILLFVILLSSLSAERSFATDPTGSCINSINEGIEYRIPIGLDFDSDSLRRTMEVFVGDGTKGRILGMEVEVANLRTRYQCTQVIPSQYAAYSCNSMPLNSKVNAVYLLYLPNNVKEGETVGVQFRDIKGPVLTADLTVRTPFPCSVSYNLKEFAPVEGSAMVINTADCDGNGIPGPGDPSSSEKHKYVDFLELPANFRLTNISRKNMVSDVIDPARLQIDVIQKERYSYNLRLYFSAWDELVRGEVNPSKNISDANYWVEYQYDEIRPYDPVITFSGSWYSDPITQYKLPLALVGGRLYNIRTSRRTPAGDPDFPRQSDFYLRFWYENNTGTLGYENSVFHFERSLSVQFGPYCSRNVWTEAYFSGVAETSCEGTGKENHLFSIDLTDKTGLGIWIPDNQADCSILPYCRDLYSVYVTDAALDPIPPEEENYYFAVRKCADSACSYLTKTSSYLYSITVADGSNLAFTYKSNSHSDGSITTFAMKAYENSGLRHPFMLMKAGFMADEPGTYMVFGFLEHDDILYNDLSQYAAVFYLTVGRSGHYASYDSGYTIRYANTLSALSAAFNGTAIVPESEETEETGPRFAADELELPVGQRLTLDVIDPGKAVYMIMLSDDGIASYNEEENSITGLSEGELTAYLADMETVDIIDSLTIHVKNTGFTAEADSETETEENPAVTGEISERPSEEADSEPTDTAGSESEPGPRFSDRELTLFIGDQVTLSVLDSEAAGFLVGLSGDTDAVLWDDLTLTVTGVTPGDVQAFLSTFDVVEVKDICRIHIIADPDPETAADPVANTQVDETPDSGTETIIPTETVPGPASTKKQAEEEVSSESETELTTEAVNEAAAEPELKAAHEKAGDPEQEVICGTMVEPEPEVTCGTPVEPESEVTYGTTVEPETEPVLIQEKETISTEGSVSPELPEKTENIPLEVNIRDLPENGLQGFAGGTLIIERDRFELPDEIFTRLYFSIENEWVAGLTERSAEEMLICGIEVCLLNAGETRLLIYIDNDTDPLREIRVFSESPASEESPLFPALKHSLTEGPGSENEPYPVSPSDPTRAEMKAQTAAAEPAYELFSTSIPEKDTYYPVLDEQNLNPTLDEDEQDSNLTFDEDEQDEYPTFEGDDQDGSHTSEEYQEDPGPTFEKQEQDPDSLIQDLNPDRSAVRNNRFSPPLLREA